MCRDPGRLSRQAGASWGQRGRGRHICGKEGKDSECLDAPGKPLLTHPTHLLRQRVREAGPGPEGVEMLGGQTPAPLSEGSPPHTPTPRGGLCPCPRPPPKSQDFCRTGATKEAQLGKGNRLMLFQVLPNLPSTLWKLPPASLTSSPSSLSLPLPPGATTSSCNVP